MSDEEQYPQIAIEATAVYWRYSRWSPVSAEDLLANFRKRFEKCIYCDELDQALRKLAADITGPFGRLGTIPGKEQK
jgi:hypothetical protein